MKNKKLHISYAVVMTISFTLLIVFRDANIMILLFLAIIILLSTSLYTFSLRK